MRGSIILLIFVVYNSSTMTKYLSFIFVFLFSSNAIFSQDTLGLIKNTEKAYQGYTLYSPFFTTKTYLLDMEGKVAQSWETGFMPGAVEYLTPEGNLLKACRVINNNFRISGKGGLIQLYDNKGIVKWSYNLIDENICQHHSIMPMPNGNILAILWHRFDKNTAIEMGRNPKLVNQNLYMLKIVEIMPIGQNNAEIVWEWNSVDHLVQDFDKSKPNYGKVSEHPELIDFNYVVRPNNKKDYLHANSIDYNAEKDLIMVSVRAMDEIWVIDHSSGEMASLHEGGRYNRGGDIIFRWGNPKAYSSHGDTTQTLVGQHDAHWLLQGKYKGNIMVFNNGRDSIKPWSSVDIIKIVLPDTSSLETTTKAQLLWRYQAPNKKDFYSTFLSGAQMLPNGNILIIQGQAGRIFEINANKKIVWEFVNPHFGSLKGNYQKGNAHLRNYVFKAKRYSLNYPGVQQ